MPRADFNNTLTLFRGTGPEKVNNPIGANSPCRLVAETGILPIGAFALPIGYYLTIAAQLPQDSWILGETVDLTVGDWVAVPFLSNPRFTVVTTKLVDWDLQAAYYRSYLVEYRHVRVIGVGGVLLGGLAVVVVHSHLETSIVGSGGLVLGGVATIVLIEAAIIVVVGSGGVVLGGNAHIAIELVFPASAGGVAIGGLADIDTIPAIYWQDSFTDTNGTLLSSHTGEVTPGGYSSTVGSCEIQSNKCVIFSQSGSLTNLFFDPAVTSFTASGDWTLPGGTVGVREFYWVVRRVDGPNRWYAKVSILNGLSAAAAFELRRIVAGVDTLQATGVTTLNAGTTYSVLWVISPTAISLTINAVNVAVMDSTHGSATLQNLAFVCPTFTTVVPNFEDLLVLP